jgi:hypothetical protein
MEVERLHIAEFTKYSDKQCKVNSGNECQAFRGAAMVMGMNIIQ